MKHHDIQICDGCQSVFDARSPRMTCTKCNRAMRLIEAHGSKIVVNPCTRCGGTGTLDQFKTLNGGICYKCNGTGKK